MDKLILTGARVFDGAAFHENYAIVLEQSRISALCPIAELPEGEVIEFPGGTLAPGLVDLQVNGGGGVMLDGRATLETIATICAAHADLGATTILPTLITDTRAATQTVLAAGIAAVSRVPGFGGLHLEGPHLDPKRPGCHPPGCIRPMDEEDIETLLEAKTGLPALIVTLSPANATPEQIARLSDAGIVVSLGHSDCSFAEAQEAISAGARMVTHLFNAMSQLGSREPGLVGAALSQPVSVGLIADGIHVHPETIRLALEAKRQGEVFLVSDAMACAGSDLTEFDLAGRRILRRDGALRLEDGTLAGADLSLPQAVRFMIEKVGVSPEQALAMASRIPAEAIGAPVGRIAPGLAGDLVHLDDDWRLTEVWQGGQAKSSTA
ncbi:N-acetylglucosamine-6-phosphate deacetylase [Thioclava sp. F34-6]|uniref:N-acetylglucosamine-6-phosphate deacetylase n=1 Tax=Thioclava sp. F34-6 TaxID=1973003 RepID=UPI000B539BE8|nr:N-acetylglucosamine-6-phosphate deacetylase [Thioclava sp. F34-6]OWY13010.1 N-acetylglucosamine-6-phosphate deacetylase [Thioclava sp. F34-6]